MKNLDLFDQKNTPLNLGGVSHAACAKKKVLFFRDGMLHIFDIEDLSYKQVSLHEFSATAILLEYIPSENSVGILTDTEIILYDVYNDSMISEKLTTKILAGAWNQSDALVAVILENGDIKQFYTDYGSNTLESIYEANINDEVPASVYVGWGSQNTQFRGNLMDRLYGKNEPDIPAENGPPTISWKGNGEYFVVNYWKDNHRHFRVFDKESRIISQSMDVNGLQELTAMKNEGNLIATVVKRMDGHRLAMFERNGCIRFDFPVAQALGTIKRLLFHPSLPLILVNSSTNNQKDYLGFYYYSNGVWYLKQQIVYAAESAIINLQWGINNKNAIELFVIAKDGLKRYMYRLVTHCYDESSVCAVIDGRNVQFSVFNRQIIPPPLATHKIAFEHPVNKILINQLRKLCLVVDSMMKFSVLLFEDLDTIRIVEEFKLNPSAERSIMESYIGEWRNDVVCVAVNKRNDNMRTLEYIIFDNDLQYNALSLDKLIQKEVAVGRNIYRFALGSSNQLHYNDEVLEYKVTSFFIYKYHLLFTTVENKLYCLAIDDSFDKTIRSLDNSTSRTIEQGATIVCVIDGTSQVLLQMPRGNLEVVTCSLLAVKKLDELLDHNDWKEAFAYIRAEKLTWNLLIDLDPGRFLRHIGEFIECCDSPSSLAQICGDLCLPSMIKPAFKEKELFLSKKRYAISQIMRYLEEYGSIVFLPSLVSVILKHIGLKKAVEYLEIYFLKGEKEPLIHKYVEQGVNQLKLYSDAMSIFCVATVCYDLEFLSFIVRCLNFNPLAYEPKIKSLSNVSESEKRYEMALWGGHIAPAVGYLLRLEQYSSEFVARFITKKSLHSHAYRVCPSYSRHFPTVSALYATHLAHKGFHFEAGLIFKRADLREEAFNQFRIGLHWRNLIPLFKQMGHTQEEQYSIMNEIVLKLLDAKEFDDATNICVDFLKDPVKAVTLLMEKEQFKKALDVILLRELDEFHGLTFLPAIQDYVIKLTNKIEEVNTEFKEHFQRLQDLRYQKVRRVRDAPSHEDGNIDDMYSETETTSSQRSDMSSMSSRARRKEEKKKIDLKKGGKYEDIALVRHLHNIITRAFNLRDDYQNICYLWHNPIWYKMCYELQKFLVAILDDMTVCVDVIWCQDFINPSADRPESLIISENFILLDDAFKEPPKAVYDEEDWRVPFIKD